VRAEEITGRSERREVGAMVARAVPVVLSELGWMVREMNTLARDPHRAPDGTNR